MINENVIEIMKHFSGSFINVYGELIIESRSNIYFRLEDCKNETDLKCKVLEWCIRPIFKGSLCLGYVKNIEKEWENFCSNHGEEVNEYKDQVISRWKDENKYITDTYHRIKESIEKYLGIKLDEEKMKLIYCRLGNAINHGLTVDFVKSGYDTKLLK